MEIKGCISTRGEEGALGWTNRSLWAVFIFDVIK